MLVFHRSLLGSRLLAIGFALSMIWAGIILVTSVIEFNDLILLLEKYMAPDGHISQPSRAVAKLLVAPGLVMSIILMVVIIRQTWSFPIYVLYGYLLFVGMHFIFFLSYIKVVLGNEGTSGIEDSLLEWGTFGAAMLASILFLISGILRTRFAYLLFIAWLIFALEEISWGQRLFNIESPSFFGKYNYQQETNIHNLFNPYIIPFLYPFFNSIVFLSLTWFRRLQILSKLYRMQGVSYVLDISDRFGLWLIPFFLIFFSFYPGREFVEEQWGVFGVLLSSLLLYSPAHRRSRPELAKALVACRKHGAQLVIAKLEVILRKIAVLRFINLSPTDKRKRVEDATARFYDDKAK